MNSRLTASEWTQLATLAQTLLSSPSQFSIHAEMTRRYAGVDLRFAIDALVLVSSDIGNGRRERVRNAKDAVRMLEVGTEQEREAGRALSWAAELARKV